MSRYVTVANDLQGAILIMPFGAFGNATRAAFPPIASAQSASGHKWAFNNVRFSLNDVRFTPESGHVQCNSVCPLCANSGN